MIAIEKIRALTPNPKIIQFSEFVIAQAGEKKFPDYQEMDLMEIPQLVRHIWVFDFRNGVKNGVPFHFSGTHMDNFFKRNITGEKVEDVYQGNDANEILEGCYYKVYAQKKIAYTIRVATYKDKIIDKTVKTETILFPCSNNNMNINFGVGLVEYTFGADLVNSQYLLL